MTDDAQVTIFRFDPTIDDEPRYQTYKVPPEGWKNLTVLETIRYIYKKLDSGLAFREACRFKQVCGICMVRVNKKHVLACDMHSQPVMLIEPASNHALIKDLVVRFESKTGQSGSDAHTREGEI